MCFFKILNDNSGAIQAILVAILIIVTICYAYYTKQMTKATKQMNESAKRQLDLIEKPYIGIDRDIKVLVKEDKSKPSQIADKTDFVMIAFTATNIGKTPATMQWKCTSSFKKEPLIFDNKAILYPSQNLFINSNFD